MHQADALQQLLRGVPGVGSVCMDKCGAASSLHVDVDNVASAGRVPTYIGGMKVKVNMRSPQRSRSIQHSSVGSYETIGSTEEGVFGDLFPTLNPADIGYEKRGNLWYVNASALPILSQLFATATYTPTGTLSGQMVLVAGQTAGNGLAVFQAQLAAGNAAMIERSTLASGTSTNVAFSSNPQEIAALTGGAWPYALLSDQPPALLAAASVAAAQPVPGQPPAQPATGQPTPGQPAPGQPTPGQLTDTSWYLPAGLVALGAAWLYFRKKP